jgi:uncharacterized tellurite resistance protein B-like protein
MDFDKILNNLSNEKKLALASFGMDVIRADGEIFKVEAIVLANILDRLGLDIEKDIKAITENDYSSVLKKFNHDEAMTLGVLLGAIAASDGVVSFLETSLIEELLNKSGIDPEFIPELLEIISKFEI